MSTVRRSRKWSWTLFARDDAQADDWCINAADDHLPLPFPASASYCIYQVEVCPETNRVHLQGFSYYENAVSLRRAKEELDPRAHLESSRGTVEENITYCSKEESAIQGPFETGRRPQQGRRTDWHDARELVSGGATDREVMDLHPNLAPNWRGIEKMREVYSDRPIYRAVRVTVLYGPTGVGKTHRARFQYPEAYIVRGKYAEGRMFDNYKGEQALIMDEWRHGEWPITVMNTILDPFGFWINCRYQNRWSCWTHVIITTNEDEMVWYYTDASRNTFIRRISHVYTVSDRDEIIVF